LHEYIQPHVTFNIPCFTQGVGGGIQHTLGECSLGYITAKGSHLAACVLCTWNSKNDIFETSASFSYLMSLRHSDVNYLWSTCVNITGTIRSS